MCTGRQLEPQIHDDATKGEWVHVRSFGTRSDENERMSGSRWQVRRMLSRDVGPQWIDPHSTHGTSGTLIRVGLHPSSYTHRWCQPRFYCMPWRNSMQHGKAWHNNKRMPPQPCIAWHAFGTWHICFILQKCDLVVALGFVLHLAYWKMFSLAEWEFLELSHSRFQDDDHLLIECIRKLRDKFKLVAFLITNFSLSYPPFPEYI